MLRRKMGAGIDVLGDDNDIQLGQREANATLFQRCIAALGACVETLKPFKSDLNYIKANYD